MVRYGMTCVAIELSAAVHMLASSVAPVITVCLVCMLAFHIPARSGASKGGRS